MAVTILTQVKSQFAKLQHEISNAKRWQMSELNTIKLRKRFAFQGVINTSYLVAKLLVFMAKTIRYLLMSLIFYISTWLPAPRLSRFIGNYFARYGVDYLGLDYQVIDKDINNIPPKPNIFISNHSSLLEGFVYATFTDFHAMVAIHALKSNFSYRIFRACKHVVINRDKRQSRANGYLELQKYLQQGENILVFPEGTRSYPLGSKFNLGAFRLSYEHNIPITPLFCHYVNPEYLTILKKPKALLRHMIFSKKAKLQIFIRPAIKPSSFKSVEEYTAWVYNYYVEWQKELINLPISLDVEMPK